MEINRRFVRWQIDHEVKVKLEDAPAPVSCTLNDISFMGAKVCLPFRLASDTFVKLCLSLSEETKLDVEVWVAWHKTIDGHHEYGLYFTKIKDSDKEKIYQFIRCNHSDKICEHWWSGIDEKKGDEKMEDRRIFQRFNIRFPMRYLELETGREGIAETQDISAKGIGLIAAQALKAHSAVEIWLQIPDKGEPLYTRGEVVWSREDGNEYRAGVSLEKADLMGLSRVLRA